MDFPRWILDLIFKIVKIFTDQQYKSDNKYLDPAYGIKGVEYCRDEKGSMYAFIDLAEYNGKVVLVSPNQVDDFRDQGRYLRAYIKCYDPLTGKILYWWENQAYYDVLSSNMCTWFATNEGKPIDIWKYQ